MKITAIKYSATMQRRYELESLEEIPALQDEKFVLWIDLTEPTNEELFPLKSLFGVHPLAINWIQWTIYKEMLRGHLWSITYH